KGHSSMFPSCISKDPKELKRFFINHADSITCEIDKVDSVGPMVARYKEQLKHRHEVVQQGTRLSNDQVSAINQTCGAAGDEEDKKLAAAIAAKSPTNPERRSSGGVER